MILFIVPFMAALTLIIAALIFGAAFVFIRKPSERPNRFGSETAASSSVNAVASGLKRIFDFQGRANRTDFWIFALFVIVMTGLMFVIPIGQVTMTFVNNPNAALPSSFSSSNIAWLLTVIAIISVVLLILALASLSLTVRRLHDINRSGWWILLLFVFGYFILLYWFLQPSQKDTAELF